MITADDYELAEAALLSTNDVRAAAMRMLRDECGWSLKKAIDVIELVWMSQGKMTNVQRGT
jgi:hypothetical protein